MVPAWERSSERVLLGASLAGQGRFAPAEPLLVGGYEGLAACANSIPPGSRFYVDTAGAWIVRLYQDWRRPEQAAGWAETVAVRAGGRSICLILKTGCDRRRN